MEQDKPHSEQKMIEGAKRKAWDDELAFSIYAQLLPSA